MRALSLTFAAALLLAPLTAEATISRAMKFDEKVENAAAIVVGKCIRQTSQWDAARNWILTYSTFQVEKTLKGQPAQEITIVTPGGQVGDIAQDVVGVPRFRQGDENVLFVRNSNAGPTVLYLDQGAYRVVKDDRGNRMVNPLVSNAVLVDMQRGSAVAPERPRPLREFEGNVRATIRHREALRMEMVEREKKQKASLWHQVQRNKTLVFLALIGAALATWQLMRRTS
ncbi:MAG TPA: hypothetical protein VEK11_13005 [Thermoanaerobaculia bacterium]|jgi:hypothetical protein|nr:hypothetical protein [Thermoanaerobaculia bacterium]